MSDEAAPLSRPFAAPTSATTSATKLLRAILGVAVGIVARLWLATLRLRVVMAPELAAVAHRPWVLCFWHGTQFPLLAWRRRGPTAVLVSHSADGAMQARALALLGMHVFRGSSSRGGARGLAAIVAATRRARAGGETLDAAFAVDGPRGPRGVAKGGALVLARATGAVLVPLGGAAEVAYVAVAAWDRFCLPRPFSRVVVTLGAPLEANGTTVEALSSSIEHANGRAADEVAKSWKSRGEAAIVVPR